MAKGYWVSTYFSVSNPDALAEYAKLAGPAIAAGGGRFIARGTAAKAYEKGVIQRCVIIEFDSVEKAAAAHDGPGYQAALKVLGNAAQRDIRIVVGRVRIGADEAVLLAHAGDVARDEACGLVLAVVLVRRGADDVAFVLDR